MKIVATEFLWMMLLVYCILEEIIIANHLEMHPEIFQLILCCVQHFTERLYECEYYVWRESNKWQGKKLVAQRNANFQSSLLVSLYTAISKPTYFFGDYFLCVNMSMIYIKMEKKFAMQCLPLSSIRLWLKSIVWSAGLLFVITDTANLWRKSAL